MQIGKNHKHEVKQEHSKDRQRVVILELVLKVGEDIGIDQHMGMV